MTEKAQSSFSNKIGGDLETKIKKKVIKKKIRFYKNFSKTISPWLGMYVQMSENPLARKVNKNKKNGEGLYCRW